MGLYHDVTEDAKMNLVAVQIPLLTHGDRPLTNHPVSFFFFFAFHTKFIILTVPICVFNQAGLNEPQKCQRWSPRETE